MYKIRICSKSGRVCWDLHIQKNQPVNSATVAFDLFISPQV